MASKSGIKSVTIINKNYPPSLGITGVSASQLADYLKTNYNIEPSIVTTKGGYSGVGNDKAVGKIYFTSNLYSGKNKILRLFASITESFFLIQKSKRLNDDVVIVMTDPPFLSFWASKLLRKRTWILWSMDLFPDAFVASGLAGKDSWIYKYIHKSVYTNPPRHLIALGDLQANYLELKYNQKLEKSIIPCGIYDIESKEEPPTWHKKDGKIYFGYCGNLGEAHSLEFLERLIKNLDPSKHKVILAVYGAKSKKLLDKIGHLSVVKQVDNVPRKFLPYIDIHLVSLLTKWAHICVPSKAVSAICSQSAFLFYGSTECDNWDMLQAAGWFIDEGKSIEPQIISFLNSLSKEELIQKKKTASQLHVNLKEKQELGYQSVGRFIVNN